MTVDFGVAQAIAARSFGEPGQRTFRLDIVSAGGECAWAWLEKEHLLALRGALAEALVQLGARDEPRAGEPGEFPEPVRHDFRVGRMGMAVNSDERMIVLQIEELVAEDSDPGGAGLTLAVQVTPQQAVSLIVRLHELIAAGRPVCALCGLPIDAAGHACIRSNGHRDEPLPRPEEEES